MKPAMIFYYDKENNASSLYIAPGITDIEILGIIKTVEYSAQQFMQERISIKDKREYEEFLNNEGMEETS